MPALPWDTALITGASSGIGNAMARLLAIGGVPNLVVVARDRRRLEELAHRLHDRHGTEVEVVASDLASPESRGLIESRLRDRGAPPVDLLVNNAGVGTRGAFAELPIEAEYDEIQLNVMAVVRLTRVALPTMIERGRGSVMNISSLASLQPTPGHATYAATKAFVTSFSESLHEEVRGSGVSVTAVMPGFTRTEFQERAGFDSDQQEVPAFLWMSPEAVAAAAIESTARGKALCVPGLGYRIAAMGTDLLPRDLRRWIMGRSSGMMSSPST